MGLLDNLLMSANTDYGGQQGGLLDMLQTMAQQNSQYQPSAGFPEQPASPSFAQRYDATPNAPQPFVPSGRSFDSANFDPSTFGRDPAQPIAIGNYQMPRMGTAPQFAGDPAALPQNAQSAQGQMPPQAAPMQAPPAPQTQQLPPALGGQQDGFLNNLSAGFQSIGNGGSLIGAITGNRTDPQSQAQQNLGAQYKAVMQTLIDGGTSPREAQSKAMLAVMNPEAGKTILTEALTNKEKYGVISDTPFEGKKYGFVNERDQTVNGKPINAQTAQGSGATMEGLQAAQNAGVKGDALYEYLPKTIAPMVKAMVEGRQPLPSPQAMRNPATLALIDAAHAIDPTFDAASWAGRQSGVRDFASGKSSEMVRAANQTLAHVGSLLDSMDNLKNTRIPAWNAVGNFANEQTGGGQPGAFRTNAHAVAEEMSKVFKGANLSDSEIRNWEQNLSENMSPEQQRTQIAKLSELLHGSLHALDEKRVAAIGPMAAEKAGPIIKDEGQKTLKRIDEWVNKSKTTAAAPAVTEGATATNPKTGQKITFTNGKWQ